MPFQFHIRPVGELEQGYELSCDGILSSHTHHDRFIEAVIHAVQASHRLPGEIHVHGCDGDVIETLPLRWGTGDLQIVQERRAA